MPSIWSGAFSAVLAPKFPLYHTLQNLSSENSHKIQQKFFPKFVQNYLFTNEKYFDIIINVKRKEKHKKIFKK